MLPFSHSVLLDSLGLPIRHQLWEFTQTHVHWVWVKSVIPFSSCPQYFPAWGSFLMSQLLASGGQSIGASSSVLPMNIQGWFPLGLTGLIFLQFKGLSKSLLRHHNSEASILQCSDFFTVQLSHLYIQILSPPSRSCVTLDMLVNLFMSASSSVRQR